MPGCGGSNDNPYGMPPDDPPGGYDIGSTAQSEKDAAWAYLGHNYTSNYQNDLDSLTRQAIFQRIPHARTGERQDWGDIEEWLTLYGHELGTPITGEDKRKAREAVAAAQRFYDQVNAGPATIEDESEETGVYGAASAYG